MKELPAELWDRIVSYSQWNTQSDYYEDELRHDDYGYKRLCGLINEDESLDIKTLCILRLVSKLVSACATRRLIESHKFILGPGYSEQRIGALSLLRDYFSKNNNLSPTIAESVHQIRLDLAGDLERESAGSPVDLDDYCDIARRLFQFNKPIRALEVRFPSWESKHEVAPSIDLMSIKNVTHAVCNGLPTACDNLTDLTIAFPCTHDIKILSEALPDRIKSQLRHLYLEVTDASGSGGSRDYLIWAEDDADNDESFLPSRLQIEYPNADYMTDLFGMVSQCKNLKSLGLVGTQHLNASTLDWQPVTGGLETVFLYRIKTPASKLIELLSCSAEHTLALRRLWMDEIQLTDGTWAEVFDHIASKAPALTYFHPDMLEYSRESPHWDGYYGRPWEDRVTLETLPEEEADALRDVFALIWKRPHDGDRYRSELAECYLDE